ncbi:hypothetical protein [Marinobacter sp.]|uniref:hypothetical protein n=1 Tax=Marinobacter sp. TaxID=50741 RepID=UPI003A938D16
MKHTLTISKALLASSLFALAACGGGGSSSDTKAPVKPLEPPETAQGVFLDSEVEGLNYTSGRLSGLTDSAGIFRYEVGQPVTFSVGDIVIGTATGAETITPLDLVAAASDTSNSVVINIARFLQTLDDDGDPDNGITLLESVRALAANEAIEFNQPVTEFEDDGNVQTVVSTLTAVTTAGARMLVTAAAAQTHLDATLAAMNDGGGSTGDGEICADNTATDLSLQGNNAYAFTVDNGECLGLVAYDLEKAELPLIITTGNRSLEGLIFDNQIKVAKQFDSSISGNTIIRWYFTFNVTNTSSNLFCGYFRNLQSAAAAQDSSPVNFFEARVDGNYFDVTFFNNPYGDCISPGQTLPVYGDYIRGVASDDPLRVPGALSNLGPITLRADFRVHTQTLTPKPSLQANYFKWRNNGVGTQINDIEVSFTNTLDRSITLGRGVTLQPDSMKVRYFDNEGFFVSSGFVYLHDALGVDRTEIQSDDLIIPAGETFVLANDGASIGVKQLNPASATKAVVFLEWEY